MFKIYKIVDNTNGDVYIGITKLKLYQRLNNHKQDFKRGSTSISRDIIKNGDYRIELIEETDDKTRERYWIENTNCINITIPGRTRKEHYEDNKKRLTERNRNYQQENKEYFTNYNKNRSNWWSSMCGSPFKNNMSLLKIDPDLFYYETNPSMNGMSQ